MKTADAVAPLRPRPSGPPLRGRAPLREGITDRRLVGRQHTEQGTAGSTLNSPFRGRRLGVGANRTGPIIHRAQLDPCPCVRFL